MTRERGVAARLERVLERTRAESKPAPEARGGNPSITTEARSCHPLVLCTSSQASFTEGCSASRSRPSPSTTTAGARTTAVG